MIESSSSESPTGRAPASNGYLLLAAALLMTALAYLGTLHFGFVYDDGPQIVLNPTLTAWHSLPSLFLGNTWKFLLPNWAGNYYRPVFMSWLLVNRMLWGLNPAAWHASLVLLHMLATWMAFVVARQILGNGVPAGFTALFFGLHPIHIESVAWISGVTDPLMAVFVLAAFWAWKHGEGSERYRGWWQVLSAVFYSLGCLTKETALPLPLVVLAYQYLFHKDRRVSRSVARMWALWAVSIVYLIARTLALHGLEHSIDVPANEAVLTVPLIIWEYLRRLVWPVGLSLFYDLPPVASALQWRFWLPMLSCLALAGLAWRIAKRAPVAVFSLLWILLFLAPAILGLRVFAVGEWIHDRYLYLPSFGLCLLAGYGLAQLSRDRKLFGLPAASTTVAMILAAMLSFATAWQEQYWANSLLLYVRSVNMAPQNPWAKGYLAGELLRRGDQVNARRMYQAALELDPRNWKNNMAFGLMLYNQGDYRGADEFITHAVNGDPTDPNAHFNQGMSRFNYGNYAGAEVSFREALRRNPTLPQAHYWLGYSLEREGKADAARQEYYAEAQAHPESSDDAKGRLRELTGSDARVPQ